MTVIPVKALFITIIIWTACDILDANVLHWFDQTSKEIFAKAFYETSIVLCCWLMDGIRIPT